MAAQNADLTLAINSLHTIYADPNEPALMIQDNVFALPDPRHSCIGGTKVRTCTRCGGVGMTRIHPTTARSQHAHSTSGPTLAPTSRATVCAHCSGKGVSMSACKICLASERVAWEKARREMEADLEMRVGGDGCEVPSMAAAAVAAQGFDVGGYLASSGTGISQRSGNGAEGRPEKRGGMRDVDSSLPLIKDSAATEDSRRQQRPGLKSRDTTKSSSPKPDIKDARNGKKRSHRADSPVL
ncbi:hypothetical protein AAFC00_000840 [Neodothiora populina]|uniref:Stc1 domain-containing protein n=1 Tax=Neodothiora populina TaxID=2781224 RepID=A0ABR3PLW4_9PEZI